MTHFHPTEALEGGVAKVRFGAIVLKKSALAAKWVR
jgi:hypothetical protein